MLNNRIELLNCFLLYLENVENGATIFGNKDDSYWPLWIQMPLKMFDYLYCQWELMLGVFLKIPCASKMKICVNFYLCLYFPGDDLEDVLQEWDGQTQCDHLGEILTKIGWLTKEIFNGFFCFPCETTSTWKMKTKLCSNSSCRTFFVDFEFFDHNPQTILQLVISFLENWLYVFSNQPGKARKGSNIFENKYQLV